MRGTYLEMAKLSLRGGFGIFDQMPLSGLLLYTSRLLPHLFPLCPERDSSVAFPHPLASLGATPALAPQLVQYQNNKQPYVMQWNTTLEQQLSASTLLTVGYVATRGLHLGRFTSPF